MVKCVALSKASLYPNRSENPFVGHANVIYRVPICNGAEWYNALYSTYLAMLTQNKSLVPALHQVTSRINGIKMHNMAPCCLHFE